MKGYILALLFLATSLACAQVSQPVYSFSGPNFSSWSTLGSGCTNSSGTSLTGSAAIQVIGQASTTNTCGVSLAASGTFTHIFVINTALAVTTNQFSSVLVGFTDGTKYEACGLGYNSGSLGTTAIESTTLAGVVAGANGTVGAGFLAGSLAWFRLRSTAGTTLACDYSPDQGQNWINLFNDTTPFLTVSSVFFGANSRGATVSQYGWLVSYN